VGDTAGIWLVELAALSDGARVVQTVATVPGVRERPGRSLLEGLTTFLCPKHVLLLLDNCEHLLGACAALADALLHSCPRLTILATSREALGIAGEQPRRVPSLGLPDPRARLTLEQAAACDAVQLFVQRAQVVRMDLPLSGRPVILVAQICRRLDGIPLALELAAARLAALSLDQLAARLDDRFRLLTGGSRTALPRQQTLRATLDWSYDLLGEPERLLLQRLSVFAGGWTLEAAEAICAGDGIVAEEALALFEAAYTLHSSEGNVAGATWTLNYQGMLAMLLGDYQRATTLLEQVLPVHRQQGDLHGVGWALCYLACMQCQQGEYARAVALFEESLAAFQDLQDKYGISYQLWYLANTVRDQHNYEQAKRLYRESLQVRHALMDKRGIAECFESLVEVAVAEGQPVRAARLFAAAHWLRETSSTPLDAHGRPAQERAVANARTALGEDAFAAAWAEGRALSLEEAVALALEHEVCQDSEQDSVFFALHGLNDSRLWIRHE
jgi:predicted ATPase